MGTYPVFLHKHALESEVCGDGCDLAGLVGLDATDGDEVRVASCDGIGEEVLEFSGFVAAVCEACHSRSETQAIAFPEMAYQNWYLHASHTGLLSHPNALIVALMGGWAWRTGIKVLFAGISRPAREWRMP